MNSHYSSLWYEIDAVVSSGCFSYGLIMSHFGDEILWNLGKIIALLNLLLQSLEDVVASGGLEGTAYVDVGHLHNQVVHEQVSLRSEAYDSLIYSLWSLSSSSITKTLSGEFFAFIGQEFWGVRWGEGGQGVFSHAFYLEVLESTNQATQIIEENQGCRDRATCVHVVQSSTVGCKVEINIMQAWH